MFSSCGHVYVKIASSRERNGFSPVSSAHSTKHACGTHSRSGIGATGRRTLLARFRTIQVGPKDLPAILRQSHRAVPATFVGDLTMSERVVEVGQSWASDIIGIVTGIGLYSVLFSLVTFLCLYVPA
jgi:hypothetical protein